MKSGIEYHQEFQTPEKIKNLADQIKSEVRSDQSYHFMEFCGGHTHVIFKNGLRDLLPENLKMIHGPGCPVCVLPANKIDASIGLLEDYPNSILCTYGDLLRIPGNNRQTLFQAKARGLDIRMIYSPMDCLTLAKKNPEKNIIFMAIGFETTIPPTAAVILQAKKDGIKNFFVYCQHVLTPPAIGHILDSPDIREMGTFKLDGFVGPGHVSTIIGFRPYTYFAQEYQKPVVICGFQPLDMMQSLLMLVRQVNKGTCEVENQYGRAVTAEGNLKAQKMISEVFDFRDSFEWRGLGKIPYSAFKIKNDFQEFDAEARFKINMPEAKEHPHCECGAILRGVKKPTDCKLFGKGCTPDNPKGSCMVSSEGACSAYYSYGFATV